MMRTPKSEIVFRGPIQILQIMKLPFVQPPPREEILWFASLSRRFHLAKKKSFTEQIGG